MSAVLSSIFFFLSFRIVEKGNQNTILLRRDDYPLGKVLVGVLVGLIKKNPLLPSATSFARNNI